MAKVISFSDLKLHSSLSGLNEVQMLSIDMDDKINAILAEIGFDVDYGITYFPAKHRNLQNNILIGFMAAGEVSINRKHLTSVYADLTDVLIAASFTDPSLTKELANLSGLSRSYDNNQESDDYGDGQQDMPANQLEEDWEDIEKQIRQLEEIRDMIRGPQMDESGSAKTAEQYKAWAKEQTTKGN